MNDVTEKIEWFQDILLLFTVQYSNKKLLLLLLLLIELKFLK